jgi:hypothetical protein
MQLASTTTVLNIVNSIVGDSAKYADKGANYTYLLAWDISYKDNKDTLVKEIKDLFTLAGLSNRVKVTTSAYNKNYREGGRTYLRINAGYNK